MVKAAVLYEANQPMPVVELKQSPPKAGEVLLKLGAAGICASDYHIMTGAAKFPLPMVLGHEGAGTVVELGTGASRLKVGDRCALSFVSFCGFCRACRNDATYMCDTHRGTGGSQLDDSVRLHDSAGRGVFQFGKLGVFAELTVVPQTACFPIPNSVTMEAAALVGCAVSTGFGAVANQPIRPGDGVAIFGVGGIGLSAIMGARALNADPIIAIDIHDHKLKFAQRFGATHTINSTKVDSVAEIRRLSGGGVEWGFDTFGSVQTTNPMLRGLAKSGTGVVVGLATEGSLAEVDLVDMTRNEKKLIGSYYGSRNPFATFEQVFKLIEQGVLDVEGLIQRRYGLEQVNEAFADLASGKNGRGVLSYGR